MIKNLKANKTSYNKCDFAKTDCKIKSKNFLDKLIIVLILAVCLIFISNPSCYSSCCLNAISVWAFKVLPVLFPFFIFTKIIVALISPKQTKLDKLFSKIYHTPATSSTIYLLSVLSGYPMGAKLICSMYERGIYSTDDAKQMMSFCSVSGPMFIVGTVGVAVFGSVRVGYVILAANIIASLLNGLIYRGKNREQTQIKLEETAPSSSLLADSVYDSLKSILLVGAYMVLAFLMIDLMNNTHIFSLVTKLICGIFSIKNCQSVNAVLAGIFEITRGVIDIQASGCPLQISAVIASGLIGFGGISILLQSLTFLKTLKIKTSSIVLQKITQGMFACLVALPLSLLFL